MNKCPRCGEFVCGHTRTTIPIDFTITGQCIWCQRGQHYNCDHNDIHWEPGDYVSPCSCTCYQKPEPIYIEWRTPEEIESDEVRRIFQFEDDYLLVTGYYDASS